MITFQTHNKCKSEVYNNKICSFIFHHTYVYYDLEKCSVMEKKNEINHSVKK